MENSRIKIGETDPAVLESQRSNRSRVVAALLLAVGGFLAGRYDGNTSSSYAGADNMPGNICDYAEQDEVIAAYMEVATQDTAIAVDLMTSVQLPEWQQRVVSICAK